MQRWGGSSFTWLRPHTLSPCGEIGGFHLESSLQVSSWYLCYAFFSEDVSTEVFILAPTDSSMWPSYNLRFCLP